MRANHRRRPRVLPCATALLFLATAASAVERQTLHDGQLLLEGVPPIPAALAARVSRYQGLREAGLLDWTGDGEGLLVRSRLGDVAQVYRVGRPGAEPKPMTSGEEPVRQAASQPGGRLIAFTRDRGGDERDRLYLLESKTGAANRLGDDDGRNAHPVWSGDGAELAWQSTRRTGRVTDVWTAANGNGFQPRLELAAPRADCWWLPLDFSRDRRLLLIQQYCDVTNAQIHLLDRANGNLRRIAGGESPPTSNAAAHFDRRDRGIFFITNRRGRAAEVTWQPLKGTAEDARYLRPRPGWNVVDLALAPHRRQGAFLVNQAGISEVHVFDTTNRTSRPLPGLPDGVVRELRFSDDGYQLAMEFSGPATPGDIFSAPLGRRGLRRRPALERWTDSGGDALGAFHATLTKSSYATFDTDPATGEARRVPLFVYRPEGDGPHPVVIWIHGGPESQFRPSFNPLIHTWVNELGAAVLAPNIRGSVGYGGDYAALDNGRRREDAVRDIGALLDWVSTRDDLDPDRVALYGGSYGGYVALAAAIANGDRLAGVVNRNGISDFVSFLEGTRPDRRDFRRAEYGDERDPEMRAFLERISPLRRAGDIRVPLLVAQGRNDPRVPWTQSRRLVDAVRANGQPVWYLEAGNEGHGFRRAENVATWHEVLLLFLRQHLL